MRWWTRTWCRAIARWWQRPGGAVILDTETTDLDGEIIEIAIADAATGQPLFTSLVQPTGKVNPAAAAVHGITDDHLATAPTWPAIWQQVNATVGRRTVLAWNAPYDSNRIEAECRLHNLHPPDWTWRCLMRHTARYENARWRRLNGGHRALGDCIQAHRELLRLTARTGTP